jgi:hypothetical protein
VNSWGGGRREGEIERAPWPLGDGDGVKCGMRSDSSQFQSRFDSFFGPVSCEGDEPLLTRLGLPENRDAHVNMLRPLG